MVITVAIQKGGVGKSTSAAVLAQAAAYKGKSVLAVDLDVQANLTTATGATATGAGSRGLLDGIPAENLIQTTYQGIDVIPAARDLGTVTTGRGSARRLQKALEPIKKRYDYIITDSPTTGELQYNALQAADGLIIPMQVDGYNIQSLYLTVDTAEAIRRTNPGLRYLGIIFTAYDNRASMTRQVAERIIQTAAELKVPYLGRVRQGIAIKEAALMQQSLYQYAPKSNPAQDYLAIFEKIERK